MKRQTILYLITLAAAMIFTAEIRAQQGPAGGDGNEAPAAPNTTPSTAQVASNGTPAAINPADIVQLVSSSPWCGSDDGLAVVIPPPTGVPPAELNRTIYDLIHSERSWSLTDVKRAVRLMGATHDPSATTFLNQLLGEAAQIVRTRSAALRSRVRRNEATQYQAYLQKATLDLKTVIREQLPRT